MKKYFLLCLCVSLYKFSFTQFDDSTHYYFKYAATGIANNTNDVKSFILNNTFNFNMHKKKADLNSTNAWIYGKQDGALTNNDFSSILNLDLVKNIHKVYYWGLVDFITSYSLKIHHQFQAGAGIGYTVFNNKTAQFIISDGILYETIDLEDAHIGRDNYQTARNSLRLKYKCVIGNVITIDGTDYWQPSLSSFNDYIIQSVNWLSVKLKKWLSLTSAVAYNRFSRTDRYNLLVSFGLTVEKYF